MNSFWLAMVLMFAIFSAATVATRYLEMKKQQSDTIADLKARLDAFENDTKHRLDELESEYEEWAEDDDDDDDDRDEKAA